MLRKQKVMDSLPVRILKAIQREVTARESIYGLHWGDPDVAPPLKFIRDNYLLPYIYPDHCALEIGPGGGRWTRYLLGFKKLYVVDYHAEALKELESNFNQHNMVFIKNSGTDFPGVERGTVDFLFSFGTFVHLELHLIISYLENIETILKPGGNVVIQYSDMDKIMARQTKGFVDNTPEVMRQMVEEAGYTVLEEDLTTLWHSSVIRFTR
jgi:phospholipid N-methyltransferase